MKRITNLLVVFGFIGAIAAPPLLHAAGVNLDADDVRAVEARPEFAVDAVFDRTWWSRWNTYLEDHFPVRDLAVSANQRIEQEIFGTTSSRVTFGEDGWLFLTESLRAICDADIGAVEAHARLTALADRVEAAGASVIVSVIPNKETIYPDLLGEVDQAGAQCGDDERKALIVTAADANDPRYLDAFALLAAARSELGDAVYFRTDSHWSDAGALVWVDAVVDAFGLDATADRHVEERAVEREGDLVRLAGITDIEDVVTLDVTRAGVTTDVVDNGYADRSSKVLSIEATTTGAELLTGTTLVIHDSFLDPGDHVTRNQVDAANLIRLVASYSERTVFVHWDSLGEVDLDALIAGSDRVVVQVVERLVTTRAAELGDRD